MEKLKTSKIQTWRYGTMLGVVGRQEAIKMVESGFWVIMTEQAIAGTTSAVEENLAKCQLGGMNELFS